MPVCVRLQGKRPAGWDWWHYRTLQFSTLLTSLGLAEKLCVYQASALQCAAVLHASMPLGCLHGPQRSRLHARGVNTYHHLLRSPHAA
jgi:hypothetical protein